MPSRRTHTKSHHGCRECKQKRVKCDEKQPSCSRCTNRSQACTYGYSGFILVNQESSPGSSRSSTPTSLSRVSATPTAPGPLQIRQFTSNFPLESDQKSSQLQYHYIHFTAKTLLDGSKHFLQIWEESIQRNVMSHDFLYHGALALASLHLAVLQPEQRLEHVRTALKQQNLALTRFRTVLTNVSEENYEAVLAFSGLLLASAFALPQAEPEWPAAGHPELIEKDEPRSFKEIFIMFHGMIYIYRMGWMKMLDQSLSRRLRETCYATRSEQIPAPEAEESLDLLDTCKVDILEDQEMKVMYKETTEKLKNNLRRVAAHPGVASFVVPWPANVPKAFITSLDNLDPIALVILAHWAVAVDSISHHWWANSWGVTVVKSVAQHVGPEWKPFLAWPLKKVGAYDF